MTSLPSGVEDDPTRPWCGSCSDPEYRLIETVDGPMLPCPNCHAQLRVVG